MGKWSLEVDGGTCIGSGMCTAIAPEHFRLEGDTSVPIDPSVDPDDLVVDAAESCPVEAILVRAADGSVVAPQP
ncbi:ferredoxin [Saccharothrix obliqua]|uniref:ferredoxin n=1 Tax=Saccharothrix obliqua TaxID=2861747 RepID=UPI001C5D4DE7|nr:ferredoxin [Saccharothrix obliqua]MBW4720856.1 ferredoxin [Saccharothrix obliqua]